MLYAISGILLILAFFKNRSKIVFWVFFLFLFFLMAFSYGNADFSTYEMYFGLYGSNLSPLVLLTNSGLFKLLCAIFTKIGVNYYIFLIFLTSIGMWNLYEATKCFVKYKSIVFALYFIYPFIIDITQIRNFVAMSFLIRGCAYLIGERNKEGIVKFIFCNTIASLFHVTFVFYFVLLLIKIINKKNLKFIVPFFLILECCALGVLKKIMSLLTSLGKTDFYFSKNISITTLCIVVMYYLVVLIIIFCISKTFKNMKWIDNVVKINLIMMLTIPLVYYSFEFMRFYRNIFFLNYITVEYSLENYYERKPSTNLMMLNKRRMVFIFMLGICIFSLAFFILFDYKSTVFIPAFENNRIFMLF